MPTLDDLKLRKATEQDIPTWIKMRKQLWPHCSYDELKEAEHLLQTEHFFCFFAEFNSEIIGFMETNTRPYVNGCNTTPVAFIEGLWVDDRFQKHGIGRLLIKKAEEWARSLAIQELASDTRIESTISIHAHKSWGFQETERVVYFKKMIEILPPLQQFEEYESFKQNVDILEKAAKAIVARHHLPEATFELFSEGTNIVFAHGTNRVIKIYPPCHQHQFKSDLLVMQNLQGKLAVQTPTIQYQGELSGWPYLVMTRLEGTLLETLWATLDPSNKIVIIQELGALIKEVHALPTHGLEEIDSHWEQFITHQMEHCAAHHRALNLPEFLVKEIPAYLSALKEPLSSIKRPVILTGEYTPMNCLVTQISGVWHITGLIDFGDAMLGRAEYDLLGPGAFLIEGDQQLLRAFLLAYEYSPSELTPELSHQLTALMLLHRYSNLNLQIRIKDWQSKVKHLKDLENLVWGLA